MTNVFEEKNTHKAIMILGLPAMLGQLATLIYNMVDTYFVSTTNDSAQIAAVTLSTPILLIIMSISSIFGMGGGSVIARLLGEKNTNNAKKSISFCFYALMIAGIAVLCAGLLFIRPIAELAGADEENIALTCDYLKWIFLGSPFIILSNGLVHIFRSTGLIKESTISVKLGNGINIVLDWLFIVHMGMGTAGAAAATSIGFLCATVYDVFCMLRKSADKSLYSLYPFHIGMSGKLVKDIVVIGIPGALITILLSTSNIVLNNTIGIYGSDAVAAYGIAYKIDLFPIMFSVGLSQGIAPMIGYCYSANYNEKLNKVMRFGTIYGIALGACFTALFLTLSSPISALLLNDEALIDKSALFLRILSLSAPMLGIINMVTSYYQALGKAVYSLVITLMRNIILFIPCVLLLNKVFGLNGAISSQCVVETVLAVICIFMYLKSKRSTKAEEKVSEGSPVLSAAHI